jgi:hypothetical protein
MIVWREGTEKENLVTTEDTESKVLIIRLIRVVSQSFSRHPRAGTRDPGLGTRY